MSIIAMPPDDGPPLLDCDEAEVFMADIDAGISLSPWDNERLMAHMRGCTDCRHRLSDSLATPWSMPPLTPSGNRAAMMLPNPGDFTGTERFVVQSRLGAGGMGVVYQAYDEEQQRQVAVKTLHRLTPEALYHLKREFRIRRRVQHPNLVTLGELVEDQGQWFFTMELIRGVDFIRYVRPGDKPSELDENRLRHALWQLAHGLTALHKADLVHRDIKPPNLLITATGHLYILDFGLIVSAAGTTTTQSRGIAGTAAYMAPEQAMGTAVTPAADWYSVGVMLYQALTGRLPFVGTELAILQAKQGELPSPRAIVPAVTSALDQLCRDLLAVAPEARPNAAQVLARIGEPIAAPPLPERPAGDLTSFVGREQELAKLHSLLARTRTGIGVTVLIHGESGLGKSALVQRFRDELTAGHDAPVQLVGRCFETESVPYNALDSLVDHLSRYLNKLDESRAAALLPRRVHLLAEVFPVLRRVPAIASAPLSDHTTRDPHERRLRAFVALRDLLGRIADRGPLLLVIDDLQWADKESLSLLAEIMRPAADSEAPALLLVATVRTSVVGDIAPVHALARSLVGELHRIALPALPAAESRRLAALMLRDQGASDGAAPTIADEASGHPLFINELVQRCVGGDNGGTPVQLNEALWARISQLPAPGRDVLALIAVAGRPLAKSLVQRASGLDADELARILVHLRSERLLRSDAQDPGRLESYHDRISVAVATHMRADARARWHRRIAVALEEEQSSDVESLAAHWHGAGNPGRASKYAITAAENASRALAFDRAAGLYQRALDWGDITGDTRRGLLVELGTALAHAGRGREAAEAFRCAAVDATPEQAIEYRRHTAEYLLHAGHVAEGLSMLEQIFSELGMKFPRSPRRAIWALLWQRLRLRLRGLKFRRRSAAATPPTALPKIDICWSAAISIIMIDPFGASYFQTQHLLQALKTGEPYRIARALLMEAAYRATIGTRRKHRIEAMFRSAEALVQELGAEELAGFARGLRGAIAFMYGRWRDALTYTDEAVTILRDHGLGMTFERTRMQLFLVWSLFHSGELREFAHRAGELLREARDRGDRYAMTNFQTGVINLRWLLADDVDEARRAQEEAMNIWPTAHGFHLLHQEDMLARHNIRLYCGQGPEAWRELMVDWPQLKGSGMLHILAPRVSSLHLRARCALAAAQTGDRGQLVRHAERDGRRLMRERPTHAVAMGQLVTAGVAAMRRDDARARNYLERAAAGFASADMQLYVAITRWRLGQLIGGDQGRAMVDAAQRWMREQNIAMPARIMALFAPGFAD